MVTRLVGVDSVNRRLPQTVITASQGVAHTDLAPGDVGPNAKAYTDERVDELAEVVDALVITGGGMAPATPTDIVAGIDNTVAATPANLMSTSLGAGEFVRGRASGDPRLPDSVVDRNLIPWIVPTGATNAQVQAILDTGYPLISFRGDYTFTFATASDTFRPAAGQTIRMESDSTFTFGTTGPYFLPFLVVEDRVTLHGFDVIHTGDYVTLDTATGRYNAYGGPNVAGWGFSAFVYAYDCDRFTAYEIKMRGQTGTNAYNAVITGSKLTNFDIHDINERDHCSGVYIYGSAGSECDGNVRRITVGQQSVKSMLHYGPGHGIYLGSCGPFTIDDVHDTGGTDGYSGTGFDSNPFTAINDGHTVKVRSLGLTTNNLHIDNVYSQRAAGICDVLGWTGYVGGKFRYRYSGAHPGITAGTSIFGIRKTATETTNARCDIANLRIELDAGDVPLIMFRADDSHLRARTIMTPAANGTAPILTIMGAQSNHDVTVTNKSQGTWTVQHLAIESGTSYCATTIRPINIPAGAGIAYPPRATFTAASGAGIAANMINFKGQRVFKGGWDSAAITLSGGITLAQLLAGNRLLLDDRVHFISRSATVDTAIAITQDLGLGPNFSGLVMFHLGQANQSSGVVGLYWIVYNDHAADYTTAQLIGSQVVKNASGNQPSTFTVAISNVGVATITATRSGTVPLNLHWSAQPLISLQQV